MNPRSTLRLNAIMPTTISTSFGHVACSVCSHFSEFDTLLGFRSKIICNFSYSFCFSSKMEPSSQEDEYFKALLKPIQDVTKNWDIDLTLVRFV